MVASAGGQSLSGIALDLAGRAATTDASGAFRFELPPAIAGTTARLVLSGPDTLTRALTLALPGSRDVTADVIGLSGGFDLTYYRSFVRDNTDSPGVLRSLRRWTKAPRIYLKTVDEAGQPIEAATIEPVASALVDEIAAFTGGRLTVAGVERGTESREGQSGWITVKWPSAPDPTLCGRAQVAVDGGWIELYYRTNGCSCYGQRIAPGIARHEMGHALGFYHTPNGDDVMYSGYRTAQCDRRPSARERLHGAIAYSRPVGNADPDSDPTTAVLAHAAPIVIDN